MSTCPVAVIAALLAACQFQPGGAAFDAASDGAIGPSADADPSQPDASRPPDARPSADYALSFDGVDDFIRVQRQVATDFTLEAWIRTDTQGNGGTQFFNGTGLLFSNLPATANDFGAVLLGQRFAIGTGAPNVTVRSNSDVVTGEWVHVAATRRQSTSRLAVFVNGVMENSSLSGNTDPLADADDIIIGANLDDVEHFTGLIDEIRIWRVVRSEAEIAATMNTRLSGDEPDLVGYWRFDDGGGEVAADSSPSGNHGLLGDGDPGAAPTFVVSDAPVN